MNILKNILLFTVAIQLIGVCRALGDEEASVEVATKIDIESMIKQSVEQPVFFAGLIREAKMEEAVNYFVEIIGLIEAQNPEQEVKATKTAIMTSYMFKKWSSEARKLADKLSQAVAPELLSPIVAAAAVVMGNQAPLVTDAFLERVPEAYAQTLRNSGAHPETVLPQGLLVSIGLPVPHSVPATGREPTALPLAPPLDVEGAGTAAPVPPPSVRRPPPDDPPPPPEPPPVPPTYSGQ